MMATNMPIRWLCFLLIICAAQTSIGAEHELNGQRFTMPDGLQIELVAAQPLIDRPVSADFDELGRLYVTDSSGSNESLDVQRQQPTDRIVRLVDNDGDGIFDSSTVYADKLTFPEGALWYEGSLYVAAPPEIWKFTDADDDGVAEHREVWFDGKTLTHCGNDLHGPYLGPDGWLYWCKGAFAEQTLNRAGRSPLTTKAAHIFRRHPSGGPIELVMTGGMDNPVEIAFTPGGERIFTTTFLVHPSGGNRDGLIHAVYGGVYGKDHNVLDGHPRTGPLMPVLAHLGVSASCGLTRLESDGLGQGFRNNLLATSFNLHNVTRHVLTKRGATFDSEATDLLVSDNLDFHPTDVLEDSDGSVIVVDTGGWFRLCCPTSQLEKPDILGGIYRIRKAKTNAPTDPRGIKIGWQKLGTNELAQLLADDRFAVRNQARRRIGALGLRAVKPLDQILKQSADHEHRLQAVWALTWIDDPAARVAVREALSDKNEMVRQAALHSVSLHRDALAADTLTVMLDSGPAHNRRAAAEALGRIGSPNTVAPLLSAVSTAAKGDRFLEHSLIYAAIELNNADAIRKMIGDTNSAVRRAALIALDQLEGDDLHAADVQSLLVADDVLLNDVAWWIAGQHPDWGETLAGAFETELKANPKDPRVIARLTKRLRRFSGSPQVQRLMANSLQSAVTNGVLKLALIDAMSDSRQVPMPASWKEPLREHLSGEGEVVRAALNAFSRLSKSPPDAATVAQLREIAADKSPHGDDIRLQAINLIPAGSRDLSNTEFEFVCDQLQVERDVTNRSLAVDVLKSTSLDSDQLNEIAARLPKIGTMELRAILDLFATSKDAVVGSSLIDALLESPAATSLPPDRLSEILLGYGDRMAPKATQLLARIEAENRNKVERIESVLALIPKADIRRGLKVFQSSTAACIACHRRAYLGGDVGPDLSAIGKARSERDLLESILFPSLTFVRNYEPAAVLTVDGQIYNGVIRESSDEGITLQLDAKKSMQIPANEIEETRFSDVSIMPAGLEKQLTPQQLADLVKYLKEG
jgi:putative membrane-bound dehydrogenase-like protein